MSLEDKVGEMTQLTLDMVCVGKPFHLEEPNRIDSAKLRKAIVRPARGQHPQLWWTRIHPE